MVCFDFSCAKMRHLGPLPLRLLILLIGKPKAIALNVDVSMTVRCYRYYAGWADGKITGKTIPIEGIL